MPVPGGVLGGWTATFPKEIWPLSRDFSYLCSAGRFPCGGFFRESSFDMQLTT